jgi:hypothetical protein
VRRCVREDQRWLARGQPTSLANPSEIAVTWHDIMSLKLVCSSSVPYRSRRQDGRSGRNLVLGLALVKIQRAESIS